MSGNSTSSALHSAPIVIAFAGGASSGSSGGTATASARASSFSCSVIGLSTGDVRELELADLQLVAVLEPVRLDAMAVDVGAVERAEVVEGVVAAAAHEEGVVARDGDVVEEDVRVGAAADRHAVGVQREALADAPAARADDERGALVGDDVADVDRYELTGLVDAVRRGGGLARRGLLARRAQVGAAARAVVRALGVDEAALRAVERHQGVPLLGLLRVAGRPAGEDVGELLDVVARDDLLAALVLLAQTVDELGAQDVDLAVEDAALVGDVDFLLRELLDQVLELLDGERAEFREGVHAGEHTSGSVTLSLRLRVPARRADGGRCAGTRSSR